MRFWPLLAAAGCIVPDPGPGDTLPAEPPLLAPPVTVSYRDPGAGPIADPSLFPDSELLDLYLPATIGPQTGLLLWVHGGGWTEGDRKAIPAWVLQQVPRGYIVASAGYRLTGYDPQGVAHDTFPAAVEDVKIAVRALAAFGAGLGTSPRVIVAGGSAGGHLASFVGATPGEFEPAVIPALYAGFDAHVAAVVNIVGPTDLATLGTAPTVPGDPGTPVAGARVSQFLGCPPPVLTPYTCPPGTDFATASPVTHYDAGDPPTYFGYGGIDDWVPAATQGAPAAASLAAVTGEDWMAWYDLAEGAWHDLDGRQLNMTALHTFMDAARDGQFEALRETLE